MAGYAGGQNGMEQQGLDQLFNQMRQRNSSANSSAPGHAYAPQPGSFFSQSGPAGYLHPSVSSPLPTPPVNNQPPHHDSAIISPASEYPSHRGTPSFGSVAAPAAGPPAGHTNSLLNLLKFSQPSSNASKQQAPVQVPHRVQPGSNAADLMATLMGTSKAKENEDLAARLRAAAAQEAKEEEAAKSPSVETQAYLLQLLNLPKPAQSESPQLESAKSFSEQSPDWSGGRTKAFSPSGWSGSRTKPDNAGEGSSSPSPESSGGKAIDSSSSAKPSQGLFTYVNPFEQLAASSPRHRGSKPGTPSQATPSVPQIQILKRKGDDHSALPSPAHSKAKLNSPAAPLPSASHAKVSVSSQKETVAEALQGVGDQIDKEVASALARAEDGKAQERIESDLRHMLDAATKTEFESNAQIAAAHIKKELEKDSNVDALENALPAPVAKEVKKIIDGAAEGHMPDSWESEDFSPKDGEVVVKVYNFPMKPWISIGVHPAEKHQLSPFRDDEIFDVARLKKDFDQIDRTLVTASVGFVVYGMSKNGGMRVIRQLDGKDMKLFEETRDRVFNVSISTASDSPAEAAIGTGVSGTVYWADLRAAEGEYIQDASANPNDHGFALPPIHSPGEETSGGMLKTRARKSSSHPEFFAVGRGKSIHIIWPAVIIKQNYLKQGKDRVVDTDKYLQHQSLKINTGKAGKDFIFSQDDTTIVSLDKAGKVKFWDVQTLTSTTRGADPRIPTPEQIHPVEIKEPIMSFSTTRENTKAWPTSVQFIDKLRPYQKGGPLRYLLVGMKQNHTLQLWDLVLRRAVQEIRLPHEKESDAVCSIAYHPTTGILAVGHPTRNSIFFIHVSAPKYDAPKSCTQAEFMTRLANKDPSISQPKSTAVMSGIREYSFAGKGQLRSLDMLHSPTTVTEDPDNPVLFELYTMHSKGVTYLAIKQEDMGWNKDHKVIDPVDGVEDGMISVESLKEVSNHETVVESPSPKALPIRTAPREISPSKNFPKSSGKVSNAQAESSSATTRAVSPPRAAAVKTETSSPPVAPLAQETITTNVEKSEKKKKRKEKAAAVHNASTVSKEQAAAIPAQSNGASEPSASSNGPSIDLSEESISGVIKRIEGSVSAEVSKLLTLSLDGLYKRFDDDRRAQAAQGVANQEAVIRLVAATLDDNIGKKLEQIVNQSLKNTIVPSISQVTTKAINDQLGAQLNIQLKQTVGKELRSILPDAVTKSLHQADVLKGMSDALANGVAFKVEEQFASMMQKSIAPTFTNMAVQAAQKAAAEVSRQASEQIDRQAREYNGKIDQLSQVVTSLTEMISSMATAQAKFQDQFLKFQQQPAQQPNVEPSSSSAAGSASRNPPAGRELVARNDGDSEMDRIINDIATLANAGNFEEACMRWLQLDHDLQQAVFGLFFAALEPSFVREISPLMLLSVASVCTQEMEGPTLLERLSYVEAVLREFAHAAATMDDGTLEVTPRIMGILIQRLEHLLIRISGVSPQDMILRRISAIIAAAKRVISQTSNQVQSPVRW